MTTKARSRKVPIAMVSTIATMGLSPHRKTSMPHRKSTRPISNSAGNAAMRAGTFQDAHASNRTCRTTTFSRGSAKIEFHRRYSRSHCLTSMPNNAEARLETSPKNHNVFTIIEEVSAWNGGCTPGRYVELTNRVETRKLLSWDDTCVRIPVCTCV